MSVLPFDAVLMVALDAARCVGMRAADSEYALMCASGVYVLCSHEPTGTRTLHRYGVARALALFDAVWRSVMINAVSGDDARVKLVWRSLLHVLALAGVDTSKGQLSDKVRRLRVCARVHSQRPHAGSR
jgi:hypothetical protein